MKKAVKVFSFLFISIAFLFLLVLLLVFFYVKRNIDFSSDEELFISSKNFESTVFYANSGTDGEYVPIISENTGSLKKSYALIDEIPESLKKGFIAVEDRRFYEHCGIDLKRTILAASNYLFKREKIFGASTITQQVIKNISGDNEIKLSRKFSEILRALHIEKCFGKDEILEVYLNIIPMSEEIYGAKEAAKCFFGKELSNLSVAQIATIIGVTNAPTAYNPYSNPDNCLKKRNSVLSVMFSEGVIGKNEYDKAMAEELSVIPKETREDRYDSWFTEAVIDSVSADLAKEKGISVNASRLLIVSGGYSIYTTMNPTVQKILEDYFSNLDNFPSQTNEGLNFAFTVLDSNNANLLGIIGRVGKKQANRLLNHALVPHTPASTLKPLSLYAPLIDEGKINYSTVLDDVPVEFYETEGEYRAYPRNSPDFYDGLLTIKDCLRLSKNTAAIRLCKLYGAKNSYNLLKNSFGFNSLVEKRVSSGKTYTDIATSPMALGQLTDGV